MGKGGGDYVNLLKVVILMKVNYLNFTFDHRTYPSGQYVYPTGTCISFIIDSINDTLISVQVLLTETAGFWECFGIGKARSKK